MAQQHDFDAILEHYKEGARAIGRDFQEPDDDWMPILFVESDIGAEIIPLQFGDDEEKQIVTEFVIPGAIKLLNGWMAVLLISAWMIKVENPTPGEKPAKWDELPGPRPSEHPDRIEVLQVTAATKDRLEVWSAKILRDGEQPPVLSEWEKFAEGGEAELSGRFVEALREGLK